MGKGADDAWLHVRGVVVQGHRVASGAGRSSPYPAGTIALQIPCFRRRGLDLSAFHPATLNVSIAPRRLTLTRPSITFREVRWTAHHPPEDFSFSPCRVAAAGVVCDGLVYHPHPATKARHFQDPSTVEVLAPYIPDLRYGDAVVLQLRREEVQLDLETA